jgi:hypothetical protein
LIATWYTGWRSLTRQSSLHRNRLALAAISLDYGVVQLDVTIVNVTIESIGHSSCSWPARLRSCSAGKGGRKPRPVGEAHHDAVIEVGSRRRGILADAFVTILFHARFLV